MFSCHSRLSFPLPPQWSAALFRFSGRYQDAFSGEMGHSPSSASNFGQESATSFPSLADSRQPVEDILGYEGDRPCRVPFFPRRSLFFVRASGSSSPGNAEKCASFSFCHQVPPPFPQNSFGSRRWSPSLIGRAPHKITSESDFPSTDLMTAVLFSSLLPRHSAFLFRA